MWPVIWPPSSTCKRRQRAVPSTLPEARTTSEPRAVNVPSIVPAISASSTSISPLNIPPGDIASSVAWIMLASTVPSTTSRSASCTVPCTLIPRPTTNVRRSDGSRDGERAGGRPGRGPAGGTTCGPGAVVNGGRDMVCASCDWAGRKGGTPRPVSIGLLGVPEFGLVMLPG